MTIQKTFQGTAARPSSLALLYLLAAFGVLAVASPSLADTGTGTKSKNVSVAISVSNPESGEASATNTAATKVDYRQQLIDRRKERTAWLTPAPVPPKVKSPTFNPVDQFIAAKWEQAGAKTTHSPRLCGDTVFLRRVYLDLVGVIPTVAEAQKFLHDASPNKRAKLVDELLARNADYAANWTPFWEDALASADTNVRGGIATHGNLRNWIYQSSLANKPYDVMVAELLDPLMPGYQKPIISTPNGKMVITAFVQNENHNDTVLTAANTAQVFLGTGMKCASCHNHFLNKEWPQTRFMAFAGMFATNNVELVRCEKESGNFVPAKFPFELPGIKDEDIPADANERLHRLTLLLVDPADPRFARTLVNRLWKRYVGIGLFAPADDFRLDQPPVNPELLDWLADDFIRHGYDLKHSIRLILTSRTYQLQYDPALEDHFDVAKPAVPRYYRSPSLRRLTAEQMIDSIRLATSQSLNLTNRLYLENSATALSRALGKPAARSEVSTSRPDDVAVVQALELLNGTEFYHLIYRGKVLDEAANEKTLGTAVDRLYWAAYTRAPTSKERKLGVAFLKAGGPGHSGHETYGDILWALFASPEFQYIR
jgi:hypothetical protein